MKRRGAHSLYGSTNESFGIPDAPHPAQPNRPAMETPLPIHLNRPEPDALPDAGPTSPSTATPRAGGTPRSQAGGACGMAQGGDAAFTGPFYSNDALILGNSFRKGQPKALDGVVGQRLADALAVWECFGGAWMRDAPLLLRFEDFDLVASRGEDGRLALWTGAVDTARRIDMVQRGSADACLNDRLCPAWKYERSLSVGIGSQVLQVAAATDELLVLDLESGRLVLECGPDGLRHRFEGR